MDDVNEQYPLDGDTGDVTTQDDSSSSEGNEEGEEKVIPESRFREVYGKMKNLEREITTLKEGKKEGTLTEEQSKELQAKQYLKGLLKETLEEEKTAVETREKEQLESFKEQVNSILDVHTDVKKGDFLKFLEDEGDDYASISPPIKRYKNPP